MSVGRPKKYHTIEEIRQSKRDKALRWYYKSKDKPAEPKQYEEVEEVRLVESEEDDVMENRASIIKSVISDKMKDALRRRLR
jgi:hypothetical protein